MFLAEGHQRKETTSRSNVAQSRFLWTHSLARCLGDNSSQLEWCNPAARSEKQIYRENLLYFWANKEDLRRHNSRAGAAVFHEWQNCLQHLRFFSLRGGAHFFFATFFNFFPVSLHLTVFLHVCTGARTCVQGLKRCARWSEWASDWEWGRAAATKGEDESINMAESA